MQVNRRERRRRCVSIARHAHVKYAQPTLDHAPQGTGNLVRTMSARLRTLPHSERGAEVARRAAEVAGRGHVPWREGGAGAARGRRAAAPRGQRLPKRLAAIKRLATPPCTRAPPRGTAQRRVPSSRQQGPVSHAVGGPGPAQMPAQSPGCDRWNISEWHLRNLQLPEHF